MKIHSLDVLVGVVRELREYGVRVAHCHGVFDLLTHGHMLHLRAAKRLGDALVVTVTPDQYVHKGPNRPILTERQRLEMVEALGFVDYVALNQWPTAAAAIRLLQPAFYVKGQEYRDRLTPQLMEEELAINAVGGKLVFTSEAELHTTEVLEKLK